MRHSSWCAGGVGKNRRSGDRGDRLSREVLKFSVVVGWRRNVTSDRRSSGAGDNDGIVGIRFVHSVLEYNYQRARKKESIAFRCSTSEPPRGYANVPVF